MFKKKKKKKKKKIYSRGRRRGWGALIFLPNMWFFLLLIMGFQRLFKVNFAEDIQFTQT